MALGTFVYLSDVNNLSDARYAAGMGVDLIGFKLNPKDADAINPDRFREISEWISGVKIVGEFGLSNAEEIREYLEEIKLDYLMIADPSQIHDFAQFGIPLILRLNIDQESGDELSSTLNYCSGAVDLFLLESNSKLLDAAFLKSLASQFPILLGYGIDSENVRNIAKKLNLFGISLKGKSEIRPGYKDFDEMADILEILEID